MIDRIDKDVKTAMKSGDAVRRDALRLVLSSLRDAEKDARRPLTDDEVQGVLRRELKRRREAAKAFHEAGHADRAAAEESEAALIEGYLPAQLADEDLEVIVESAIAKVGATSQKEMGQVMREAMALAAGRADGKRLQERVRAAGGWLAKFADAIAPSRPPGRHTREHRTYDSGHRPASQQLGRGRPVHEHVVEGRAQADRERAVEHGGLAEARDLEPRRVRQPGGEQRPDRLEQQVAVRADAAAEHDEADVRDRRDRGDVQRDPARHLGDHGLRASAISARARRRRPRAARTAAPATSRRPGPRPAPRRTR